MKRLRVVLGAVVCVLLGVGMGLVGPAPAASAVASPWIPPSWTKTEAGTGSTGRAALAGGVWAVAGAAGITQGAALADCDGSGWSNSGMYGCLRYQVVLDSSGLLRWHLIGCTPGWVGNSGCSSSSAPADGSLVTSDLGTSEVTCNGETRGGTRVRATDGVPTVVDSWCAGGAPTRFSGGGHFDWTYGADDYVYSAASDVLTTELTCRDTTTGEDQQVTEVGTAGAAAPAPVCPSGTIAIRVKVISSTRGVVQDTSMSTNWADWSQYMSGGGGVAVPGMGGFPCVVGGPCDDWWTKTTPAPSNADCWTQMSDLSLFALEPSDCQDANQNGTVQTPSDTGESSNNTDLNPIIRVITSTVKGVVDAVNAVRSAINAVKSAVDKVTSAIAGIAKAVGSAAQQIVDGIKGAIESSTQSILDKLDSLFGSGQGSTQGPGHDSGQGSSGSSGPVAKLNAWLTAIQSVTAAFNRPDPGCDGIAVTLPQPIHRTFRVFGSCDEPWKSAALVSKAILGMSMGVGGLLACFRILAAALGLQTGVGGGESS